MRPTRERYDPMAQCQGPVNGVNAGGVFLGDRFLMRDNGAMRMLKLAE